MMETELIKLIYDSIKNKNFSSIFSKINNNNIKEFVNSFINELMDLKKEYFTNDDSYHYYKRYVAQKLKLIGKEYTHRSSRTKRYIYKSIYLLYLYISNSYIVITIERKIYAKHINYGDWYLNSTHGHTYVVGFNSDNKLFVNYLGDTDIYEIKDEIYNSEYIKLYKIDDEIVYALFGYNYDNEKEFVKIDHRGSYRVQGDIVLSSINDFNDFDDYVDWLIYNIDYNIVRYVRRYITDIIFHVLTLLGFNVDVNVDSITIQSLSTIKKYINIETKKIEKFINMIIDELRKYIDIKEYKIGYILDKEDFSIRIDSDICTFDILMNFVKKYLTGYVNLDVSVGIDKNRCKIYNDIINEFKEEMRKMDRRDFVLNLGNHLIEIKNALSSRIIFNPSIKYMFEHIPSNNISSDIPVYFVDEVSEIHIMHHEHGYTKIIFSKPMIISFNSTNINREYLESMNRIVFNRIVS